MRVLKMTGFGLLSLTLMTACSTPHADAIVVEDCPKLVPAPWTGPLLIESKYDQSEATKTTLRERSEQSEAIQEQVTDFTKGLVRLGDYAINNSDDAKGKVALTCVSGWLHAWATENALLHEEATKTGVAVRKWALASIASVLLKLEQVLPGRLPADPASDKWLQAMADKVVADYDRRLDPGFSYFNNHDYWAAWAVASTGLLLDKRDYLTWADARFRRALRQLELSSSGQYAWLPNEIGREHLAANYTHYALVPLVMLAAALPPNGFELNEADQSRLDALVNFAAQSVLDPDQVGGVLKKDQKSVPDYKLAWLIPWLQLHPTHSLAKALYLDRDGDVDGYSQIGGNLEPWFGEPLTGKQSDVRLKLPGDRS
ncbi:alginate lyase family protein [Allohahella marinimesophila]|uniref:Alginate biosynthesis protein AlgL n=1 Tax=Allohahella marinimesophila TaxID=1054972 RepID=A0ABP7PME2_9GAMM